MPKAIMMTYTDPVEPSREEEYRAWYDEHIAQALRTPGIPRAVRYKLSPHQRHGAQVPAGFVTIYEIDADDVEAVHDHLSAAWKNGELSESDVVVQGPIVYWDFDSEILAGRADAGDR